METIIETIDLHKVYRLGRIEIHALRGVNMKVKRGEIVCVMGPSGSGKTTLLNIIGTLDKPTKGKVFLEGQDVTKLSEKELTQLRRKKIGSVSYTHLTLPTN